RVHSDCHTFLATAPTISMWFGSETRLLLEPAYSRRVRRVERDFPSTLDAPLPERIYSKDVATCRGAQGKSQRYLSARRHVLVCQTSEWSPKLHFSGNQRLRCRCPAGAGNHRKPGVAASAVVYC